MTSGLNIKQLDQSTWTCYQFQSNSYYYGEVGYLDQTGIAHPKQSPEASNPKNKLVKHGFGVYLWNVSEANQSNCKYQGTWDRDEKSGKGLLKYADGTTYDGAFHEGHYHGAGKIVWANGDQYEGNWKRSKMDGPGLFRHSSGFILKGIFKNNYFIDDNVLRNPFLTEKDYAVFKKQRKQILKQKEKQEKLKHGFSTKINSTSQAQIEQHIDKSSSNNRVPLIFSTKTVQYSLESLISDLSSQYQSASVSVMDLRKLYTLEGESKWNYRKQVHEDYRRALVQGGIFVLSLDESEVEFNEMFYPDVRQFYQPNGFNGVSWSREQVKQVQVRRKVLRQNKQVSEGFRLVVWTKFKVDSGVNEETIRQKMQLRFEKIIPFIKIDCVILDEPGQE